MSIQERAQAKRARIARLDATNADVPVPANAVPEAVLVAAWLGRSGVRTRLIAKTETLDLIESIKTYGDARVQKCDEMAEANGEASAQMINEARVDAIEMAKVLRECAEAFRAIHDAATIPGVGLPANVAEAIRLAWTHAVTALKGHVEANRNSGWDSSTWPELGR